MFELIFVKEKVYHYRTCGVAKSNTIQTLIVFKYLKINILIVWHDCVYKMNRN